MNSKDQSTETKSVRQVPSLDMHGNVALDIREGDQIVTGDDPAQEDQTIRGACAVCQSVKLAASGALSCRRRGVPAKRNDRGGRLDLNFAYGRLADRSGVRAV